MSAIKGHRMAESLKHTPDSRALSSAQQVCSAGCSLRNYRLVQQLFVTSRCIFQMRNVYVMMIIQDLAIKITLLTLIDFQCNS